MYFLRKAHDLYSNRPHKVLSLLFWESEGVSPWTAQGIDAITSGIEHPLGISSLYLSFTAAEMNTISRSTIVYDR
jgi:hypothetical protein